MILIDNDKEMKARPTLACNFECVKDEFQSDTIHEYIGPVKIIVTESPEDEYSLISRAAAGLAFVNFLIGGVSLPLLLREAATIGNEAAGRLHVILCTLGMTFFSGLGMINIYHIYGASNPMRAEDVRREHFLLHLVGILSAGCGGAFHLGNVDKEGGEKHVGSCIIAMLSGIASFVTGLVASRLSFNKQKIIHVAFGTFSSFMFTICYASGLEREYLEIFCKRFAVYGCAGLSFIHVIIFFFVLAASIIYIMELLKKKYKPHKLCVTEDEERERRLKEEKRRRKKEAKKMKKEFRKRAKEYVKKIKEEQRKTGKKIKWAKKGGIKLKTRKRLIC